MFFKESFLSHFQKVARLGPLKAFHEPPSAFVLVFTLREGFFIIPGACDQNPLNLSNAQSCWICFGACPELWRPSPRRAVLQCLRTTRTGKTGFLPCPCPAGLASAPLPCLPPRQPMRRMAQSPRHCGGPGDGGVVYHRWRHQAKRAAGIWQVAGGKNPSWTWL